MPRRISINATGDMTESEFQGLAESGFDRIKIQERLTVGHDSLRNKPDGTDEYVCLMETGQVLRKLHVTMHEPFDCQTAWIAGMNAESKPCRQALTNSSRRQAGLRQGCFLTTCYAVCAYYSQALLQLETLVLKKGEARKLCCTAKRVGRPCLELGLRLQAKIAEQLVTCSGVLRVSISFCTARVP